MKNTSRKKEEKNKCNASYLKYSCAVNMLLFICCDYDTRYYDTRNYIYDYHNLKINNYLIL